MIFCTEDPHYYLTTLSDYTEMQAMYWYFSEYIFQCQYFNVLDLHLDRSSSTMFKYYLANDKKGNQMWLKGAI